MALETSSALNFSRFLNVTFEWRMRLYLVYCFGIWLLCLSFLVQLDLLVCGDLSYGLCVSWLNVSLLLQSAWLVGSVV